MPTGPKHQKYYTIERGSSQRGEDCRCVIGSDHDAVDDTAGESLSVWDAADIWLSNGMDEDYMFGYSEGELRRAADTD